MNSTYGSYYAAPKKRPPVFLKLLALVFALGALAIFYRETRTATAEPPDPIDGDPIRTHAAEPAADTDLAPIVHAIDERAVDDREELLSENARLREELELLRVPEEDDTLGLGLDDGAQVEHLEKEVLRLSSELKRYQAALTRAVDELNEYRRSEASSGAAPPRSRPDDPGKWVFAWDPYSQMNVNRAEVMGSVHNTNGEPVTGYVVLTVYANGREVGGDRVRMKIPAKTVKEYETVVTGQFLQGPSYEVRAEWEMGDAR